jgi:hypothetical protein
MLVRICLILAILAAVAVGVLNFVQVKEKITVLQTNLDTETKAHQEYLGKYNVTKSSLDKTNVILKQTIATLESTTAERDKAVSDAATQSKRADKLTDDLKRTTGERDAAQQELAAYKVSGLSPEQVVGLSAELKKLRDNLAGSQEENKVLGKNLARVQAELDRYKDPNKPIYLPASCKGKILVTDPKWNFVVLDVGDDKGMKDGGEMLVNRNGKLVGKGVVRTVRKDQSIANIVPGWEIGEVMQGAEVIPAYPAI